MTHLLLANDPHRKPALACGCLIATALILVMFGRHAPTPERIDPAAVRSSVEVRFGDLPDGSVVATDAASGVKIGTIAPGQGGFVRVTMRSFAGDRKKRGLDDATPFTLARMNNGNLVLQDPLTMRTMILNAFGPSNAGAFAQLLDDGRSVQ